MAKEKLIKVKLFNLENRGKSISVSVNGKTYIYPDNYEGEVSEAVVNALLDAIETRYKFENLDVNAGETAESYQNERFKVVYLDVTEAKAAELVKLKADAAAKEAADIEIARLTAELEALKKQG